MRTFEDFPPGFDPDPRARFTVSKDDIVAFAREYDAQPFHVDEVAAKDSFVGTLIASGWHTCSLNMRLVADGLLLDSSAMGAPGIEEVKWVKPVQAGRHPALAHDGPGQPHLQEQALPRPRAVPFRHGQPGRRDGADPDELGHVRHPGCRARSRARPQRPNAAAQSRSRRRTRAGDPADLRQSLFRGPRHRRDGGAGLLHLHARRHRPASPGSSTRSPSMWIRRPPRTACSGRSAPRAGIRRASG